MKAVLALAVFACLAAFAAADGYNYGPALRRVYGGVAAPYNNALRQVGVNRAAEYKGASSGTARYEGVPGAGNNFGYGYGYGYNRGYYGGYNGGYYGGY